MNDINKEHLSAFLDNEIGPDPLSELEVNDTLLHRYQLIGDAVKGNLCDASLIDVSAQVHLAIENEPVYSSDPIKTERVKTAQQTSARHWFDLSGWLRPMGGMAVAASVAVVMVMVINQPETGDIGINGAGSQVAIDTRPVVSLPVNNVDRTMSEVIRAANSKVEAESEDDVRNLKDKTINAYPQENVNQ